MVPKICESPLSIQIGFQLLYIDHGEMLPRISLNLVQALTSLGLSGPSTSVKAPKNMLKTVDHEHSTRVE
jgi:hypothetical protein